VITDETLGTTETTRGKVFGVGATVGGPGHALLAVLEVEERLLADSVDGDWPGLVVARATLNHGQNANESRENSHVHQGVTIGPVKIEHLLYVYIFLKCVKDIFFSFFIESRWTKISFLIEDILPL
jgi:hypothetical protein